jgi:hypothetical protein
LSKCRQAGLVVSARSLEAAGLDLEHVVAAIAVLVDPLADRVAGEVGLTLGQSRPSVKM